MCLRTRSGERPMRHLGAAPHSDSWATPAVSLWQPVLQTPDHVAGSLPGPLRSPGPAWRSGRWGSSAEGGANSQLCVLLASVWGRLVWPPSWTSPVAQTLKNLVGSVPGSGRRPGGGSGHPLQDSCLENPRDRGAWWATVHGVVKSRSRLSD